MSGWPVKAGTSSRRRLDPYVKPKNGELIMLYQARSSARALTRRAARDRRAAAQPGGYAGGVAMLRSDGTVEAVVAEAASFVLVAGAPRLT